MLTKTPFLSGFPTLLFGRAPRKKQDVIRRDREKLAARDCGPLARQLADEIPPGLIAASSTTKRERIYTNPVTFWAFLGQVLSDDHSCAAAVTGVQQMRRDAGLSIPSASTASYAEARQQLPEALLDTVHDHLCTGIGRHSVSLKNGGTWRGFHILGVDGTSVQAPDTADNQKAYPQRSSQSPGCGFPAVSLVGLIDLGTGCLRDFSHSDYKTSELRGFDLIEKSLGKSDLLIGDRLYSSYELIARLHSKGIPFIGRNHQARKVDFRRGKKLGPDERLITWRKPTVQPGGSAATAEEWAAIPDRLDVRMIRTRGEKRDGRKTTRYIITTLTDHRKYPVNEIASLYHHRWEIELRFRDIKTTMGMEHLRTRTPQMLCKEIRMHVIAYNAVRLLMIKAALEHGVSHRRIGFKGVLQVLAQCRTGFQRAAGRVRRLAEEKAHLLLRIAERFIPLRPGRNEPRKKKRRPKSYGWLQKPRHWYFEHFRSETAHGMILDAPA
jgi:hypothetical protein